MYELELHGDDEIGESWKKLLALQPFLVYYGHAQAKRLGEEQAHNAKGEDRYALVAAIVKYIDKGWDKKKIQKKTGADPVFIEDVMRMYLTHTDVGVQGILDRIEIKNR